MESSILVYKEKLSNSEYIKSRLYKKDSHFRKDPQYVFCLLWQKVMCEISSGVYNLLKSSTKPSVSVGMLLEQVNSCDEHLEAHLCTMLQSVCGTKQYWFLKSSKVKCMICKCGPPGSISARSDSSPKNCPKIINYRKNVSMFGWIVVSPPEKRGIPCYMLVL